MLSAFSFFKDVNCVFIRLDDAFLIQQCNQYTLSNTVANADEMLNHKFEAFFHIDDQEDVSSILAQVSKPEVTNRRFVHRWQQAGGSHIWLEWFIVPDDDGKHFYVKGEDVSEHKRVKSALTAIETVTDTGYWEIDLDTNHVYWSDQVHRIHETDARTFRPKVEDGISFYHPDAIPTLLDAVEGLKRSGKSYSVDLKFITSKGKNLVVNATGFSETVDGKVVRNFGTFKDLTKQKEDDIMRQRLEQRIVLALKAANIGVWEYDILHDELTWDDRLFDIYGRSRESFQGKLDDWIKSVHPDDLDEALAAFNKAVQSHTYFNHKFRVVTEGGDTRYVHGMSAFIYDDHSTPIKATGINIDLTEAQEMNAKLEATIERAEKSASLARDLAKKAQTADLQKSAFLANMSHEIRTPISGVIGLVEMLIDNQETDKLSKQEHHHYLNLVKNSSKHLLNIISDILDFSKIEAGKITIVKQNFVLKKLLNDLLDDFKYQASDKGLDFDFKAHNLSDEIFCGDPLRLKQILYNLLGNAIKFTQTGGIKVRVRINQRDEEHVEFICSIIDTGVGIAQDKLDILFMPFEQVDTSATRASQGTGLGLSITRKLIDLMSGDITVTSQEVLGSNFTVKLPFEKVKDQQQANQDIKQTQLEADNITQHKNLHVLVAEDNDVNQVVIKSLLEQLHITCMLAENGEQTIACLSQYPPEHFDFILMDCQMPVMDGFEATYQIRNSAKLATYKNIPIIALTANAMADDKKRCLDTGMNEYLAKPVSKEQLSQTIASLLAK
ncbi:PAS domain-containing protein [Glaciecola siphonariae]|uniref:histidine kinase n=1 Tax=Glaciecola siphonariae TaxID=521012 RepID=A0ABV9LXN2_9ALTE